MRQNPFNNKTNRRFESLKELAAKKQRIEADEANIAVANAVAFTTLRALRIQIANELAQLDELRQLLFKHIHDSGVHSDILNKEDLTIADLKEMEMMTDLSPELKAMLDQYIAIQEKIESLNKQVDQTEAQLHIYQQQKEEIQNQIQENETQQEQLKQETVNVVFEELSNRLENAPSSEELQGMMAEEVKIEDLDEMDPESRKAIENSLREQHPTSVLMPGDEEKQNIEQASISNEAMLRMAPMTVKFIMGFKRYCLEEKLEDVRDEQAKLSLIRDLVRRDAVLSLLITGNLNQREALRQIDNQIIEKQHEIQHLNKDLTQLKQAEHQLKEQLDHYHVPLRPGFNSK